MTVIDEIVAERKRQIEAEGFDSGHDDAEHSGRELAQAAGCYALWAGGFKHIINSGVPRYWPWSKSWWKPKNPRRDLIRAAALIVAEIERLDRSEGAAR